MSASRDCGTFVVFGVVGSLGVVPVSERPRGLSEVGGGSGGAGRGADYSWAVLVGRAHDGARQAEHAQVAERRADAAVQRHGDGQPTRRIAVGARTAEAEVAESVTPAESHAVIGEAPAHTP